ncbi:E3 ubiquitin/ISG15 ligase TRIM25 [Latimeria chalumnae]|uniref:Tripartite motif containing 25 n=1 Tax=Latimeria chalumnae TaxID=7897 RepID=H3A9T4_LATCH|nr:PREDICTED: E3 ubiquitin/ISG15 ligase TRIM25 [Latimeria chalumnae]|eukprot:XP_005999986.1 PREDICTED: E3 ubiquitin/ISG15 ligase TRIM25 [Latimeria chalumnae]
MAAEPSTLKALEEELTCSICLSTFENPVTTPCGHNFCLDCLEMTWMTGRSLFGGYSCPQCRRSFMSKPALQKNTVLCTVVAEFSKSKALEELGSEEDLQPGDVPCDTCSRLKAAKTCLTCMASFCSTHLKPHLENAVYKDHQLELPVGNLERRKCLEHNKLLEFYCKSHGKCICCVCLVSHTKSCQICTISEGRDEKELKLKRKLTALYDQIQRASQVVDETKNQQELVTNLTAKKMTLLEAEFTDIRDTIEQEEADAIKIIQQEEKKANDKVQRTLSALLKKSAEMKALKDQIESLLVHTDEITFLQNAASVPDSEKKEQFHTPKVDIESKIMQGVFKNVFSLKELIKSHTKQPLEKRLQNTSSDPLPKASATTFLNPCADNTAEPTVKPPSQEPKKKPFKKKPGQTRSHDKSLESEFPFTPNPQLLSAKSILDFPLYKLPAPFSGPNLPSNASIKSRHELLQYSSKITLDITTAHKRVLVSEKFTKISVCEAPQSYPSTPGRFTKCTQVLCIQGFSRGRHYWEVNLSNNNFCSVGICYKSLGRKGSECRLGRNKMSWCIEWFNVKLSAWHDDKEIILYNPSMRKVGVFLSCEEGSLEFYAVTDQAIPLYKFDIQFTEPIHPAFWVFSNGTTLSLCQLD